MKVFTYLITLDEPVLVSALEGDPNSGVAFPYLPGAVLRGALIGAYLREHERAALDAADPAIRRLFFDAHTCYLNAYPWDNAARRRAVPTPRSWRLEKDTLTPIFDFAVAEPGGDDRRRWVPVRAPFQLSVAVGDGANAIVLLARASHVAVHTTRTRRYGRAMPARGLQPDELPGAVYRYDALAPGQTFAAAIVCHTDEDAATLALLLTNHSLLLGGARSAGYGRAHLHDCREDPTWAETSAGAPDEDARLTVTLLSDLLLRDSAGRWVVDPPTVAGRIASRLGLAPDRFQQAFAGATPVGGFNRTWGLPLPQAQAVAMGSVFVFDGSEADPARVRDLEVRGLGERRVEGFGRLACSWPTAETLAVLVQTPPDEHQFPARPRQVRAPLEIRDEAAARLATEMARRLLRRRLDDAVLAAAGSAQIAHPPSNAQLSRLRALLYAQLQAGAPDLAALGRYVADLSKRAGARRQVELARIGDELLLDWLRRLLAADAHGGQQLPEDKWAAMLGLTVQRLVVSVGDRTERVTPALRLEYTLRYIAAVLARAARMRSEEVI